MSAEKSIWLTMYFSLGLVAISQQRPSADYPYNEDQYTDMLRQLQDPQRRINEEDHYGWPHLQDLHELQRLSPYFKHKPTQGEETEDFPHISSGKLEVDHNWPSESGNFGQVAGISVDGSGNVYVFHRADRSWGNYEKEDGPIKGPTVANLNGSNGKVLEEWGENFFYLPHGLQLDNDDNFWMTDIAMHQVFKFEKGKKIPSLVLGKAFEPATTSNDSERLCQPTDVAVASNGDFFISDGYCASRVVKYDKTGTVLAVIGEGEFNIPHSLALAEDLDRICVADRENRRILCYNAGLKEPKQVGEFDEDLTFEDDILGRVFGIAYSPKDGVLFVVNGPTDKHTKVQGLTLDFRQRVSVSGEWSPDKKGFDQPHDVDVSRDGDAVYVGELIPNTVWKFRKTL